MTDHVTPHSSDTYGLAVIQKSKDGFYVKELMGGSGNFSFDWEVKCDRTGNEKFQVVRTADPEFSPASEIIKPSDINTNNPNRAVLLNMNQQREDVKKH